MADNVTEQGEILLSVNALSATAGRIADVNTSSVTELSEAPTLDDSLLLVSRPFQFGEGEGHVAYQSMKTPLSVLAKTASTFWRETPAKVNSSA